MMKVPDEQAGSLAKCPGCKKEIVIPGEPPETKLEVVQPAKKISKIPRKRKSGVRRSIKKKTDPLPLILISAFIVLFVLAFLFISGESSTRQDPLLPRSSTTAFGLGIGAGAMLMYLTFGLGLYMIPTITAYYTEHKQFNAIFLLNIFLGWTVLGWIGALVWAVVKGETQGRYGEEKRYARRR